MPFVAAPGVIKCELLYHWSGGKVMANVLHLWDTAGHPAPFTSAEIDPGLADQVFAGWTTGASAIMSTRAGTVTLDKVVLTDLSSITGVQAESTHAPVTGGASGSALPSGDCVLIKLSSALRSRHGRGRVYVPGETVNNVDAFGAFTSAYVTSVTTGWETFLAALLAAALPLAPVILDRAAGTFVAATGYQVESIARSQRRRELDH